MKETANELLIKKGKIVKSMNDLMDLAKAEERELTAEENKNFDDMHTEVEGLTEKATRLHKMEQLNAEQIANSSNIVDGDTVPTDKEIEEINQKTFKKYLRVGDQGLAPEDREILKKITPIEQRAAQQSTTTTAGGYTIPTGFQAEIEKALLAYGGMFAAARIVKTASGNDLNWPMNDDTANKAYLLAEAGNAETSATALVYAQETLNAYKYTSGLIRVSRELIEDSYFNIAAEIIESLRIRMWRGLNEAFTTADGSSKPEGVVTGATDSGISSVGVAAITRNNILDLIHSVDPLYRAAPKAYLMFNDSTLLAIKKLAIGAADARPLWQPSMIVGEPDKIEGMNYIINQDVASMAASAKSVLFGDFSKYIIREVAGWRLLNLQERFADTDELGVVVFARYDGVVLDAGTNPIKYMVHPSS